MGQPTIQQHTTKIRILSGSMVLGVSGSIGMAQRLEAEIVRLHGSGVLTGKSVIEIGAILRSGLWTNVLRQEYEIAAVAQPVIGGMAQQNALCSALLALPVQDRAELIQFDAVGAPEAASDELPFAAIGSGQTIADPFLAFLRETFWPNRPPTVGEATFAAYWALDHAIRVNPGGLASPIFVYHLVRKGPGWEPRELEASELYEHSEAVAAANAHLRVFTKGAAASSAPPAPP